MFERYAIFYCPVGPLARFGAAWLGWDSATGRRVEHPKIGKLDIASLTKTPRKYGIHGTLKAPFHLADGCTEDDVDAMASRFSAELAPVDIGPLTLKHQNGFVGLRPFSPQPALQHLAAQAVRQFDPLRAPLSAADISRRRNARLTPVQDAQMLEWGYPYIFDDFHFHITLTGRVNPTKGAEVIDALWPLVTPILPNPFQVKAISLVGQDSQGMFHQINRYTLTG